MTTEGSTVFTNRSISLGMTRNIFVALAVVMAVVLLLWVRQEQNNINRCHELASKQNNIASPVLPPIHVYVQSEKMNNSQEQARPTSDTKKWDYNWDHRAWPNPEDAKGVPIKSIILVRHGQYDFKTGLLNDVGRKQANLTGFRLSQLNMKYTRLVHSDLARAQETARIILSHLPGLSQEEDPLLAEGGPIPPEPTVSFWSLPDVNYFVDSPRLEAAFRKYFFRANKSQQSETIDILIGHGNIFRYFVLRALQLQRDAWMRVFIAHASISLLHVNPDGTVTMTKFGDSGHMPPELITF